MSDYILPDPLDPRRAQTVGASEVASLFSSLWAGEQRPDDFPPSLTRFALWHLKHGTLPASAVDPDDDPEDDDNRLRIGKIMEPAIGAIAREIRGWHVEPAGFMMHESVPYMSATPDFVVYGDRSPLSLPSGVVLQAGAVLDAKNVDYLVWRRWPRVEKPGVWCWRRGQWEPAQEQPPFKWTLQGQQQMACGGYKAHINLAFIGGNKPRFYLTERHEGAISRLEAEIPAFWESIEAGVEPDPEWELDATTVVAMHQYAAAGKVLELLNNQAADELAAEYYRHQQAESAAKKAKEIAKARLLVEAGDAARIITDHFKVSAGEVGKSFVVAKDVNERGEPGSWRSGYRHVRVTTTAKEG